MNRLLPLLLLLSCACSSTTSSTAPDAPPPAADPPAADPPPPDAPDPRLAGRPYQVYVPKSYDASKPAALVLAFHGYGDNDDGPTLEKYFELEPLADTEGFLYVTPNGTKDKSGQRFWNATDACCDFDTLRPDDVGYVRALVADVGKHHAIDPKRVYAVGLSAGGFFAHRLACDASDVFAAVVSQSGATYVDASKCKPTDPLALVEIHGTKDDTVLFDGGHMSYGDVNTDYPSAHDTVAHWAGYDGCTGALADSGESRDVFAQYKVGVSRYACTRGAVELWTATDGVHAPAYSPNFAKTIWSFFAAHPKP